MKKLLALSFSLMIAFAGATQCTTCTNTNNAIVLTGYTAGAYTFTTSSAQAYYWTVCSGTGTISGSNTTQSISVTSAVCPFNVKLVKFNNGVCTSSCYSYVCDMSCPIEDFRIEATVEMCNATGITGRGHYTYWCDNTETPTLPYPIEWKISPNPSNFTATSYYNGIFLPSPNTNLPGDPWVTIGLYRKGTNILVTSYTHQIFACGGGKAAPVTVKTTADLLKTVREKTGHSGQL